MTTESTRSSGTRKSPELAAEGLAQRLDEPVQSFGVAAESACRRHECRTRSGNRGSIRLDDARRCCGGERANIHCVHILPASARPTVAPGSLRHREPGPRVGPPAIGPSIDTVQDKRRAQPWEARSPRRIANRSVAHHSAQPQKQHGPPQGWGGPLCRIRYYGRRSRPADDGSTRPCQVAGVRAGGVVAGTGGGGVVVSIAGVDDRGVTGVGGTGVVTSDGTMLDDIETPAPWPRRTASTGWSATGSRSSPDSSCPRPIRRPPGNRTIRSTPASHKHIRSTPPGACGSGTGHRLRHASYGRSPNNRLRSSRHTIRRSSRHRSSRYSNRRSTT